MFVRINLNLPEIATCLVDTLWGTLLSAQLGIDGEVRGSDSHSAVVKPWLFCQRSWVKVYINNRNGFNTGTFNVTNYLIFALWLVTAICNNYGENRTQKHKKGIYCPYVIFADVLILLQSGMIIIVILSNVWVCFAMHY